MAARRFLHSFLVVFALINEFICQFPEGHLKPLGSHIPPDQVDEVMMDNMVNPKDFMEKYVLPRKPLVFRGNVKEWPAFHKWTDDYLKENYGKLELRMEGRKEKQSSIPQGDICLGRDSMKNFINTYHNSDVNKYVVSELPAPLYKYVKIPPPMGCGDLSTNFVEVDMWINSGGARSILHKDSFNTINCVVNGSKEWKLVEFKYNDLIYQAWEGPQEAGYGGYSLINPEKVDFEKFPKIAEIPKWLYTHVKAGDCLYLPSQMWHVVHSHGDQNIAVALLFNQFHETKPEDVNYADCADKPNAIPLDQVEPDWKYAGFGRMSMGNAEFPMYWEQIEGFFNTKTNTLSKKAIYKVSLSVLNGFQNAKKIAKLRTNAIFEKLSKLNPGGAVTFEMVKNLPKDEIREMINEYMEPPVASNSCDHEYFHLSSDLVTEIVERLAESNDGVVFKKDFIESYLQSGGHIKIAEEMWNKYGGDKESVQLEGSEENLEKALEKFEFFKSEEDGEEDEEKLSDRNDVIGGFKSEERRMKPDFKDDESATDKTSTEKETPTSEKKQEQAKEEL